MEQQAIVDCKCNTENKIETSALNVVDTHWEEPCAVQILPSHTSITQHKKINGEGHKGPVSFCLFSSCTLVQAHGLMTQAERHMNRAAQVTPARAQQQSV